MSSDGYVVVRGAFTCATCGKEFRQGQAYFSALVEGERDFSREDYCPGCWEQAAGKSYFSFWRTRRQGEQRRPRINTEVVFDFFNKLEQSDRPDRREIRFVLALYLARRKALKLKSVGREGDCDVVLFRRPRRDESIVVEDPHLNEEQINASTARLKELFQDEL